MADKVTIHVAKTNLSKLIAKAEAGEEIVIYRGDKPAAKLVPADTTPAWQGVEEENVKWGGQSERKPGALKGKISIGDAFYDPWSPKDFGPGVMDSEPDWGGAGTWDGKSPRLPGLLKGVITLDKSFFDPVTAEEAGLSEAPRHKR